MLVYYIMDTNTLLHRPKRKMRQNLLADVQEPDMDVVQMELLLV